MRLCLAIAVLALTTVTLPRPAVADDAPCDVIVREAIIHDRYGNDLKAYYYLPAEHGRIAHGRFPAVLAMNYLGDFLSGENLRDVQPTAEAQDGPFYARRGYAFANVDFPGRGSSSSAQTLDFAALGRSGYDIVEWLAGTKPDGTPSPDAAWTNGKVGMYGLSGNGMVQLVTAQQRPPHLATIVPEVAPWDLYRFLFYPGGIRALAEYAFIAASYTGVDTPCQDVPGTAEELAYALHCLRRRLGAFDLVSLDAVDWLQHPDLDAHWQAKLVDLERIEVPVWSLGSWDDFFTGSSTDIFERTSGRNLLAMGNGGHTIRTSFDYRAEVLPWYARWLKGEHNTIDGQLARARFRYYVQREDRWRMAAGWPIPGTRFTRFHLAARSADASALTSGTLRTDAPGPAATASYLYAPGEGTTAGQYGTLRPTHLPDPATLVDPLSPGDQRVEAPVGAQFLGAPLTADTEVTGPVRISFYASSTAADTDWIVHLLDAYPDHAGDGSDPTPAGYRYKVTTGWLSGVHRDSLTTRTPIPPGQVVRYAITLYPTSYLFRKRHRIGVSISSGDGIHTVPNPNPARNTIYLGAEHPSAITLPIVPPGASRPDAFTGGKRRAARR